MEVLGCTRDASGVEERLRQADALERSGPRAGAPLRIVQCGRGGVQAHLEGNPTVQGFERRSSGAAPDDHGVGEDHALQALGGGDQRTEVGVHEGLPAGEEDLPAAHPGELGCQQHRTC